MRRTRTIPAVPKQGERYAECLSDSQAGELWRVFHWRDDGYRKLLATLFGEDNARLLVYGPRFIALIKITPIPRAFLPPINEAIADLTPDENAPASRGGLT